MRTVSMGSNSCACYSIPYLVKSVSSRLQAVIENKGGHTKIDLKQNKKKLLGFCPFFFSGNKYLWQQTFFVIDICHT